MDQRQLGALLGRSLAGRFQLERVLGRGGYGAVFEATQLSVGRKCAVKVLLPREGAGPKALRRFAQEARATSRLSHPNTVTVFDYGEDADAGVFFMAMELLDGEDLLSRAGRRPFSAAEVAHVVLQAAASLDDAHRHGIVHRDIKPQNIMVCPRVEDPLAVKVIDFGIAKAFNDARVPMVSALTMTGMIVGTPQYMAPEQVRDEDVGGACDQYALACCVYVLLAGRGPFVGSSPIDTATRHLTDDPPRLSALRPDIRPDADAVLQRALSKTPGARFESCVHFAEALAATLTHSEVNPPVVTPQDDTTTTATHRIQGAESTRTASAVLLPVESWPTRTRSAELKFVDQWPVPLRRASHRGAWAAGGVAVALIGIVSFGVRPPGDAPTVVDAQVLPKAPAAPAAPSHVALPLTTSDPALVPERATDRREPKPQPPATVTSPKTRTNVANAEPPDRVASQPVEPQTSLVTMHEIVVVMRPWGELVVDGVGRSSHARQTLHLPEGRHVFELQQNGETRFRRVVHVGAGMAPILLVAE